MRLRAAVAAVALMVAAGGPEAAGPDWAKPLLEKPVPAGGYIAESDAWVSLRTEIELGISPQGGLVRTFREVLAPTGTKSKSLTVALQYDAAVQDLVEPAVWVPGAFGYRQVKMKKASVDLPGLEAGTLGSGRNLFITTKEIEPGEKAILTWQVSDKRPFPGEDVIWPFGLYPTSELVIHAGTGGAAGEPEILYVEPGAATARVVEGDLRLESLPAYRHVYSAEDPWLAAPLTALPHVVARVTPPGDRGWETVSTRVAELFSGSLAGDAGRAWVKAAKDLTAGAETPAARTAAFAAFVQSLTYRNIEWGMGAFRPETPSESLRTGSADCKGKALLLQALLSEIGVESVPVLCRIGPNYEEPPSVPTVLAFNHVVLAIRDPSAAGKPAALTEGPGKGWVLFDPTDPAATLGLPPRNLEGTPALWGAPQGGGLFTIHTAEPGAQLVRATLQEELAEEGQASFRLRVEGPSRMATALGSGKLHEADSDALRGRMQQVLATVSPGLTLEKLDYSPPDHLDARAAVVEMQGKIPSPLQPLGGDLFTLASPTALLSLVLDVSQLAGKAPSTDAKDTIETKPEWKAGRCCQVSSIGFEATARLSLPEEWRIQAGPAMADLDAPWLRSRVASSPDWSFLAEIPRGRFEPGSDVKRRKDLEKVAALFRQPFLLEKGASR
ncbi:MAG TPA: hypothetical protein VNI57_02855 [Candidatus Saccharimonadales bacterium]|nr:hypothetical protein [Candidatus Saccharimonadales bacterium]